ncbi:ribosome-binding protein [Taxawa tesnikishii (nom. ined.)]|nr:ribosome-binding protein [Dothideales sp. JES 119]
MSMDIDGGSVPLAPQARPQTGATILCYNCGAAIDGTQSAGALCYDCVKLTVDATSGIQREGTLHQCRDCDRWLMPPNSWVIAPLESRELLALCLKKLRGLNKANQQCPDCAKSFTHNTWRAVVQVRQKVPHKRTFLYLEQLILKHGAHKDTINIKEVHDGIDFFYSQRNHAEKFVDFLTSVTPVRTKKSQELISMNIHTSEKTFKFTFSCELVPICKDDLVALPIKLAKQVGNISPLTLCYRVGTSVNLLDPNTLQTTEVSTPVYWRAPFGPLADVQELVEFIVMDIEPLGPQKGRFVLAEATVMRANDTSSTEYFTRTHLGSILNVGDSVMGYLLSGTQFNNENLEAIEASKQYASTIPDVVLVKKHYASRKKTGGASRRNWKLKRMAKEESEMAPRKQDQDRLERDFELFLRDVEDDEELRQGMALYKAQRQQDEMSMADTEDEEEGRLKIPMEQLLDEFDEMNMEDAE